MGWTASFFIYAMLIGNIAQASTALPDETNSPKSADEFRNYTETTPPHVRAFYRANHEHQTLEYGQLMRQKYLPLRHSSLKMWEAVELLGNIIDESDPDIHLPQHCHSFQTAEALRKDGHPRWLILVGFIHDLGKMLAYFGEPQWAVVGDSFPLGCAFSEKIVFAEFFAHNPDSHNLGYQSEMGIYTPKCGFDQLQMSWGHDEYLYHVVKDYVPMEAAYIIRFHSFYAAHKEGAYTQFMNDKDYKMMPWLQLFRRYDLYSKDESNSDIEALKTYYQELINQFFPEPLMW